MKHFIFALITVVLTLESCNNKEPFEMPINGVYPHLRKMEEEFVKDLNKLSKQVDAESDKKG